MRYRIAKMTIRDYEAVITLWRGLSGIGLDDDSDSKAGIARYLKRNPGLSFVARCGRTVVGAVLSGHDGRRGYLHHLAVAVPHRKQGLGQLLVNRCLRALAARGISKCNIFLFRSNGAGRAFWEHAGWNTRGDLHILQKATRRKA